jgi:hypothetical protein
VTASEAACVEAVRRVTGCEEGPLELHGVRTARVAERLAARRGEAPDRELLACAALLHDIGLYEGASSGGVYTSDGAAFARELLAGPGWPEERLRLLSDAIELHHQPRPQWQRGLEVELMRRADLVEVSGGLIRFGLDREWYRGLCRNHPRTGFYREVARLLSRQRPTTLPRVFMRPRSGTRR